MLIRQRYIDGIIEKINILRAEIKSKAKLGLLDGNIHMENYIGGLLNICYRLELKNLNETTNNFPSIDLGDMQHGIGYQVTSNRTSNKVNETLRVYIENNCNLKYPELKVFIIGEKQNTYSIKDEYTHVTGFKWEEDVNDFDDIFAFLKNAEIEILEKVYNYINQNHCFVENSISKDDFKKIKAHIRLFSNDIAEIKKAIEIISKGNSVYGGKLSRLANWENNYLEVSEYINPKFSDVILAFYRKIDEIQEVAEASKDYIDRTYGEKYRGQSLLDAGFSRYVQGYQHAIKELQYIVDCGLEEYIKSVLD